MHQLGWMFFRDAAWGLPPGASPKLGIELSNSIALVDGLPLFAFPFKLIAPLLPQPFQYWGWWLLACFVLQGAFGYLCARAMGVGVLASVIAAGLVIATPAFLFRVPLHMALSGHWTILAALWLYARPRVPRWWGWPVLAVLTSAIHAYLLAMVLGLWAASLLQRAIMKRAAATALLAELALTVGLVAATLWAVGFFMTSSLGTYGFGSYKLNLLWPIVTHDWSQVLADLPHTKFDYEGLSFLGIGVLALLAIGIATGAILEARAIARHRWWPLAAAMLAMMLFAFSHQWVIGDHQLFTIPPPEKLIEFLSMFRSSGRFVWPLLYLMTIGSVAVLARRLPPLPVAALAAAALAAQIADSAPKWREFATHLPPSSTRWDTQLVSPFWDRAAVAGYDRVRAIPPQGYGGDWLPFSYYAGTHGMAVDLVYLGRTDEGALEALKAKGEAVLETGAFEPRTLYILSPGAALKASRYLGANDLLAMIDERIVFARGGAALVDGLGIPPHWTPQD
jgi:hypothetical protein